MPRDSQLQGSTVRFRLWVCSEGHAFQAGEHEGHWPTIRICKRCTPAKPGVSRTSMKLSRAPMKLVEVVPRSDAEQLAHAVSASLTHGEESPLATALAVYLSKHPWSDL